MSGQNVQSNFNITQSFIEILRKANRRNVKEINLNCHAVTVLF